jgi:hypothetical protein
LLDSPIVPFVSGTNLYLVQDGPRVTAICTNPNHVVSCPAIGANDAKESAY